MPQLWNPLQAGATPVGPLSITLMHSEYDVEFLLSSKTSHNTLASPPIKKKKKLIKKMAL